MISLTTDRPAPRLADRQAGSADTLSSSWRLATELPRASTPSRSHCPTKACTTLWPICDQARAGGNGADGADRAHWDCRAQVQAGRRGRVSRAGRPRGARTQAATLKADHWYLRRPLLDKVTYAWQTFVPAGSVRYDINPLIFDIVTVDNVGAGRFAVCFDADDPPDRGPRRGGPPGEPQPGAWPPPSPRPPSPACSPRPGAKTSTNGGSTTPTPSPPSSPGDRAPARLG
jgi:hypothetical protein